MRTLRLILLFTILTTVPAMAGDLSGTLSAVAEGGLPDHCVVARISSLRPLDLSPRDVCTFSRGGSTLGNAVVLTATDDVAVLFVLFGRPLHEGDTVRVAARQGFVLEDAFLMRLGDFYAMVGSTADAADQKPLWNGLHYRANSDFAPNLLHLWAASVESGTVRGVDDGGLWRTLPLARPDLFIARDGHAASRLRQAPRGMELDLVLGDVGGVQTVVGGVARPLLRLEALLPRLLPRVPLTFGSRISVPATRPDLRRGSTLRVLRGCHLTSLDLLEGRATLCTFNGERVRVYLPDPLIDAATGATIKHDALMAMPAIDLVCYSDGRESSVLALGEPTAPREAAPPVVGLVDHALGADFYQLNMTTRNGLRPRDVVDIWRDGSRIGRGVVFSNSDHPMLFARAGTPPLRRGDRMTFARRAAGAYIDSEGFTELAQCKTVRQTTDPRRWFDVRGYGSDAAPLVPDLYKGGPYSKVRCEVRKSKEETHP